MFGFGRPKKIVVENPDPRFLEELIERYGKPKAWIREGDVVEIEW